MDHQDLTMGCVLLKFYSSGRESDFPFLYPGRLKALLYELRAAFYTEGKGVKGAITDPIIDLIPAQLQHCQKPDRHILRK